MSTCTMEKKIRSSVTDRESIVIISSDDDSEDNKYDDEDEVISKNHDKVVVLEVPDSPVRLVISPVFRLVIIVGCCKAV